MNRKERLLVKNQNTVARKKFNMKKSDRRLAFLFLLPALILLLLLVAYPVIDNIRISFFDIPINPTFPGTFVGLDNYEKVLTDSGFYNALGLSALYTLLVVVGTTTIGLGVAMLFNREFKFKRLARSLIILSYVAPAISTVFGWRYILNNIYGIINYWLVDVLGILSEAPLWFDNPRLAFVSVTLFAIWRYFPYAFISFLAILQSIDNSLYEAAEIDGANKWQQFLAVTLPAIRPVLVTVVTLRTIWAFYTFDDVYLLTTQVDVMGVYLYKQAFARNDLGQAAAISVLLFIILFVVIILTRRRLEANSNEA